MQKKKRHVPYHQNRTVVLISMLGFVIASLVFLQLKGGMPTGYVVYELNKIDVGEILKGGNSVTISPVEGSPLIFNSLEISGDVIGEGAAMVYLYDGKGWLLVFSNRDEIARPGFVIEGNILKEETVESNVFHPGNQLRVSIRGVDKPEITSSELWGVPSTCWESCRIANYQQDELKLYFDIEEGTAFFLDKISLA